MNAVKILLVDDSLVMRESLKIFLEGINNVQVVAECSDGNQVLEKLKQIKVDLVFSDVMMEDVGGFDTSRLVKEYNKEIKVILFSFLAYETVEERVKECGADGFVSKVGVTYEMITTELEKIPGFKVE
jgi:DNA-binding NarL/FixJ family response regulator